MSEKTDLQALTPEERELILDFTQLALDIAGIIEPTPFADLTNAAISLIRQDWVGAALSVAGVVPYLGDLAKAGKLPKYMLKLDRAIVLAKTNPKFAKLLNPILARLLYLLDRLPTEKLTKVFPDSSSREYVNKLRISIEQMRNKIVDYLPPNARVMTRIDYLTDDLLVKLLGSTKNVGALPRRNVRIAAQFFEKHNVKNLDVNELAAMLRGIDLHALDAIEVVATKPGQKVAQYINLLSKPTKNSKPIQIEGQTYYYEVGQWLVRTQGSVSARNLGISVGDVPQHLDKMSSRLGGALNASKPAGAGATGRLPEGFRLRMEFTVRGEHEMLKSKAASVSDTWTTGRQPSLPNSPRDVKGEFAAGGGDQYFLPEAWRYLDQTTGPRIKVTR
jgi:hypothetical protein